MVAIAECMVGSLVCRGCHPSIAGHPHEDAGRAEELPESLL